MSRQAYRSPECMLSTFTQMPFIGLRKCASRCVACGAFAVLDLLPAHVWLSWHPTRVANIFCMFSTIAGFLLGTEDAVMSEAKARPIDVPSSQETDNKQVNKQTSKAWHHTALCDLRTIKQRNERCDLGWGVETRHFK